MTGHLTMLTGPQNVHLTLGHWCRPPRMPATPSTTVAHYAANACNPLHHLGAVFRELPQPHPPQWRSAPRTPAMPSTTVAQYAANSREPIDHHDQYLRESPSTRDSCRVRYSLAPGLWLPVSSRPMEKLSRAASGARHHRWATEILAAIDAHQTANYLLSTEQVTVLTSEKAKLGTRITALANAVGPYRQFIETAHVQIRAKQRIGNYLCDEAQRTADGSLRPHRREIDNIIPGGYGTILSNTQLSRILRMGHEKTVHFAEVSASAIRTLPAKIPGTDALADSLEKAATLLRGFITESETVEAQRNPLRSAVNKAIYELREELEQMDGRLRSHFSAAFIDSLYPELTRRGAAVADDADDDDDTTEAPATP